MALWVESGRGELQSSINLCGIAGAVLLLLSTDSARPLESLLVFLSSFLYLGSALVFLFAYGYLDSPSFTPPWLSLYTYHSPY